MTTRWNGIRLVVVAAALLVLAMLFAAGGARAATLPSQDPFYNYSGSLTGIAPGTVLKTRTIHNVDLGTNLPTVSATQVLYRTTDELGKPIVTVTTIIKPTTPSVSTKLVSYQTAYDALGGECDPSYTLQGGATGTAQDEQTIIGGYVQAGYTVIDSDYEGENLAWGSGQQSGYATLDSIRATENQLKLPATTPVGIVGYSGGSIATEFASELAPKYAPALNIVGVAEGGVPVDFAHNLQYINGSQSWSGVIPAVLVGTGRGFNINITPYLSSYGAQVINQVKNQCINNFYGNYPGLTIQKLLKPQYQDFLGQPVFAQTVNHLIMSRTGTPKGPLFIGVGNADGTGDGVMVAADDEALAHTYCERHVSVQFTEYMGDTHTEAAVPFEEGALTFLTDRLNGISVTNGCSSIGAGNSLAPVPVNGTVSSTLKFRYLGRKKHLHGLAVRVWTTSGTLKQLVIKLRRGRKVVATVKLALLTTKKRRVILRVHGHIPRAGRYTITVTQSSATLVKRKVKLK